MIPVIHVIASRKTSYISMRSNVDPDKPKISSWSVIGLPLHEKSIADKQETVPKCIKSMLKTIIGGKCNIIGYKNNTNYTN